MKLVDANVLLSAVNSSAAHHERARAWLDHALSGEEGVILPWISLLAFVRITTQPSLLPHPLSLDDACAVVAAWVGAPNAVTPAPDSRHIVRVHELLAAAGSSGGNLVNDAHLAALALQYGATVVTFDNDFGRFPGVRWESPPAASA